jgi:hypothetical protein
MGMDVDGVHAYSCGSLWYSKSGMAIGGILILLYSYIIVVWARKMEGNDVGTVE